MATASDPAIRTELQRQVWQDAALVLGAVLLGSAVGAGYMIGLAVFYVRCLRRTRLLWRLPGEVYFGDGPGYSFASSPRITAIGVARWLARLRLSSAPWLVYTRATLLIGCMSVPVWFALTFAPDGEGSTTGRYIPFSLAVWLTLAGCYIVNLHRIQTKLEARAARPVP